MLKKKKINPAIRRHTNSLIQLLVNFLIGCRSISKVINKLVFIPSTIASHQLKFNMNKVECNMTIGDCGGLFFCVLLGYLLLYYYCTGLDCLLRYWAQVFWVREMRPIQLELKLVRLMRKLCLVYQEHAYGRQSYSEWVTVSRHDSKAKRRILRLFCYSK